MMPNMGYEPARDEAMNAANGAMGLMVDMVSEIREVISDHRVQSANRELANQLFNSVQRYLGPSEAKINELVEHIQNLGNYLDEMTRRNHKLDRQLSETIQKMNRLAQELQENKDKYREYYEKWNAEANKNFGFKRYKDEVNQRLALHEERVTILKRELDAYRMLHPESEEKVATIVAQAPDINEALNNVLNLTADIIQAAKKLHAMDRSPLHQNNNTVMGDYNSTSSELKNGLDFSLIEKLISITQALPNVSAYADSSSALLPHYKLISNQLEQAYTEERTLRQNAGDALAETLQKGASLAAMTYPDDHALCNARIDALHAVSLWREDINAANAFQLAQAGHAMNDAFGGREPSLERMLDEQAGTLDTVLRRVSPHVFPEDAPDDTDDINAFFGSSFSEDDFAPTARL